MVDDGELEHLLVSRVSIVILNWNNWPDTLECLESLLRLKYEDFRIIICDNGTTDGSLEHIRAWVDGRLDILPGDRHARGGCEPVEKPLPLIEYDRETAEAGGGGDAFCQLVMIRNGKNLGFAGGCNVGLRFIMARNDTDYVWILNNDTIVDPEALINLVGRLHERPEIGICGSTLLNYWKPGRVDALGGACYSRWLGLAWHLGRWRRRPENINLDRLERRMDYVVGSAMFVSMKFLAEVGLMDESYFLYYEELDWTVRSRGRFSLGYAPDSIVYHKTGGSIGTATHPARKSVICDYYTLRNRLKFTFRYYPYALPTIYLGLFTALFVRLFLGEWQRALIVWRLMGDPRRSIEECSV